MASTNCAVSVAMPDNRWTKFNATRSALKMARAGPEIFSKMSPPLTRRPSWANRFNFNGGGKFAERGFGKIESGDDQRFTRAHDGTGHGRFGHGGERRDVAAPDVLGQGGLDGAADFCGGQFHAVRMKPNGKREKKKPDAEIQLLGGTARGPAIFDF